MTIGRPLRIVLVGAAVALAAVVLFPLFIAPRADGNQVIEPERIDYALDLAIRPAGTPMATRATKRRTG